MPARHPGQVQPATLSQLLELAEDWNDTGFVFVRRKGSAELTGFNMAAARRAYQAKGWDDPLFKRYPDTLRAAKIGARVQAAAGRVRAGDPDAWAELHAAVAEAFPDLIPFDAMPEF